MNYYQLKCEFTEDEASFSFADKYLAGGILDKCERYARYYETPPTVWVNKAYKERNMSDVLKAIGFIPHKNVVNELIAQGISGVQFIPVIVNVDDVKYYKYFFMNVFFTYPILDIIASGARDKCMRINYAFENINKIVLSASKLTKININHDFFRVCEYPRGMFVNDKIKSILEVNKFTGLECVPVEVR